MVKMTLGVEGMMCPHREAHVNEDISKAFKVESVVSDHDANTTVVVAEAAISEGELKKVIDEAGYKLVSYACENA